MDDGGSKGKKMGKIGLRGSILWGNSVDWHIWDVTVTGLQ